MSINQMIDHLVTQGKVNKITILAWCQVTGGLRKLSAKGTCDKWQ
jgi:protein required for attachment to host cells